MNPSRYLPRPLSAALAGLANLAVDLRWSWNHSADKLWQMVDPELWEATGNPWMILETVSQKRLEDLEKNHDFLNELQSQLGLREEYLGQPTWFTENHGTSSLGTVAYFCMEFGLSESLPIYSGGLGILAGDHLKTASDMGIPLVGVGLLYQQGYFRQAIDANGGQLEFFPYNNPTMLPTVPLRTSGGEWLRVTVEMPGRTVHLRGWQAQIGRVTLYLLDSNDLLNAPGDRGITGELYGGGTEMRLQQELVLGIGGWRLLEALSIEPNVCHLNEGHAAFAVLERARAYREKSNQPFSVALRCTRAGNIFTSHTPVEAGFDRFSSKLMTQYLGSYAESLGIGMGQLLDLGRADPRSTDEPFNMAYLAARACGYVNGVSRLHGAVSRRIFQPLFPRWPRDEIPVGHVTNGVHTPSWDSAASDDLWTKACGKTRWLGTMETVEQDLRSLPGDALWKVRSSGRSALIHSVRQRLARQFATHGADRATVDRCTGCLDPNALTLGFARRFASYKRPNLLLHDRRRLTRLLTNPDRPVQLIIAGKAHPRDEDGKRMIQEWSEFMKQPQISSRAVFVEDYDMALAAELVQGVDVWVNTPRRPWEASGTSGMKVLVNGGLNLSELDGWWAEAYAPEVGWALGDGQEHDADPDWDRQEAEDLYTLLEREVIPLFYARDEHGIPTQWVARMRESMARLTPVFSTNRMLREYVESYYLPAAAAFLKRSSDESRLGAQIEAWYNSLSRHWSGVHFGNVDIHQHDKDHAFHVQVYLGELDVESVFVQLFADTTGNGGPECHTMTRGEQLTGAVNGFLYTALIPAGRPATDYTARIIPKHMDASIPLEAQDILWQR